MKVIYKDGTVAECPQEEELHVLRHSAAHIMAQAIKRLWPEVQLTIGPSIAEGWYYDIFAPFAFTPEDLEKIEADGLALCGLRFDQVSAKFKGWISDVTGELSALKDEGLLPSVPSFTAVLTVQNSCICISRDGPRCLLLSEKLLRAVTPESEHDDPPRS